MRSNRLFFWGGVITGCALVCPVMAAPSVKNFGNAVSSSAYNGKKAYAQSPDITKRAGSVRLSGLTSKPTTMVASAPKSVSVAPQQVNYTNSARSSGVRGNVMKGVSSKLSSNYASQQASSGAGSSGTGNGGNTSGLEQRITNLETRIQAKQDVLHPGQGVDIENNTIGLSQEMTGLPGIVDEMGQRIDDLSRQINEATLPANYYTADETRTYLSENYYNQQYIDQKFSSADFTNYFDGAVSANTTYVFKTDANGNGKWRVLQVQDRWDPEF